MRRGTAVLLMVLLMFAVTYGSSPGAESDLATILMRSTFKIQGRTSQGDISSGTGFILGRPLAGNPQRGFYVLVTAAHVLDQIGDDTATLHLRRRTGSGFTRLAVDIPIRKSGSPLWRKHPDVAAMPVRLPNEADIVLVSTTMLATDETLRTLEVHPGDELLVLGFPYGAEANDAGFPILRSGRIASYPLTPTKATKSFLLDFNVFAGNSGGPVFMHHENRVYAGGTHIGVTQFIAGLVSQEQNVTEQIKSLTEVLIKTHKLAIGVVIHAGFIDELVRSLPEPKDPS
jgi:S1-C subfamily serine protease